MPNTAPLPSAIQARVDFIRRAYDQLVAKRNDLRILRDVEQLFYDECAFFELLRRNIEAIAPRYRYRLNCTPTDFTELESDLFHITRWRKEYQAERAKDIERIVEIENKLQPRPDYRLDCITTFSDDLDFDYTEKVPEFQYRFRQILDLLGSANPTVLSQ